MTTPEPITESWLQEQGFEIQRTYRRDGWSATKEVGGNCIDVLDDGRWCIDDGVGGTTLTVKATRTRVLSLLAALGGDR